jgi:hypothetical protein
MNDLATAGPADASTLIAVRGYLGYVDSAIAHWLTLPEEQRSQVDAHIIARLAVGAFPAASPPSSRTNP